MKIVFATNNAHKLDEARKIIGQGFDVLSLSDIDCHDELPETSPTLEGNARQKAEYVWKHYLKKSSIPVFADDTGLEVEALGGEPGVHSARYASLDGEESMSHDSEANMKKLLRKLETCDNRKAHFRTVVSLIIDNSDDSTALHVNNYSDYNFEGIVEGKIIREKRGSEGFGYDPVFVPNGYEETFAEMGPDTKNKISHRARAMGQLAQFLREKFLSVLFLLFAIIGFSADKVSAQELGTWKCYWAYNDITEIQPAGNLIYVLSSKGLFSYNVNDHSVTTYDKMSSLNDCGITHIRYCPQAKRLVVIYQNQNIDLLDNDGKAINLSSLSNASMTADKTINHIYINGTDAYLSTGFGIVKINVRGGEIANTYQLGFKVNYSYIEGNRIFAASETSGIYSAQLDHNLLDRSEWTRTADYKSLVENLTDVEDAQNKCRWTSDENNALTAYQITDGNRMTVVSGVKPDGPAYNFFGYMKHSEGRLYTCGGGFSAYADIPRSPAAQVFDGNEWQLLDENLQSATGHRYEAALVIDHEPGNPNHIFVAGRTGLYEFNGTKFLKHYTTDNSPLQSAIGGNDKDYVLVEGMTFDKTGNLWLVNSQATSTALACLKKNGEWQTHKFNQLMSGDRTLPAMKSMKFDSHGLLWFVNAHWTKTSFYAFDELTNGLLSFTSFVNEDGALVSTNGINDVCEDYDGNMWIATNAAPLLLYRQDIGTITNPTLHQVKVPRNDGTNYADYLLDGLNITCMAIDGGNRKWMGTADNGVYLISADNMEQIYHFLPSNSNLLSKNIESIAINGLTGEVFFGTDMGLCSFMSDATTPSEEMTTDNVYAYPNPVSPDYTGLITVTGLSFDADVKITTANGVLVASGRSNGGSFTWDGCDTRGRRVASGIFMVQTATSEGKSGTVCKIAIVR